jgi:hypothetical protein
MSEKPRNPNFVYMLSDGLQQVLAISKKTGHVTCEDGVKYSYGEIIRIEGNLTPEAHRVKKLIGGDIVEYRKKGTADGSSNPERSENEMASLGKTRKENEGEQLEIF